MVEAVAQGLQDTGGGAALASVDRESESKCQTADVHVRLTWSACLLCSIGSNRLDLQFYTSRNLAKPYAQWSPPYTTAEPDITSIELEPTDDFLVMASDGLFMDLNSQQVVEYVGGQSMPCDAM